MTKKILFVVHSVTFPSETDNIKYPRIQKTIHYIYDFGIYIGISFNAPTFANFITRICDKITNKIS